MHVVHHKGAPVERGDPLAERRAVEHDTGLERGTAQSLQDPTAVIRSLQLAHKPRARV